MRVILITGVGGPAGRALVRQFQHLDGADEFTVVGADMNPVELPGLTYCHPVPAASSPAYLPAMRNLIGSIRADLVIPTVQDELPALAASHHLLGSHPGTPARPDVPRDGAARPPWLIAPMVISGAGPSAVAADKLLTMWALDDAGVSIPKHGTMSDFTSPQHALDVLGAPLVVKPRVSRGGRGVQVAESAKDLPWVGDDASQVLQQFAPGEEYCPQVYRSPHTGDVDAVVVLRKTGLKEGRVGNATGTERVTGQDVADVAYLAARTARALDLVGPLDIDIRRLATGEPVVLEVNARFGANSEMAPELLHHVLHDYLTVEPGM